MDTRRGFSSTPKGLFEVALELWVAFLIYELWVLSERLNEIGLEFVFSKLIEVVTAFEFSRHLDPAFISLRGIPRPSGRGGIARRALARLVSPGSLLLLVRGLNLIAVAIRSLCDSTMLVRDALNGTV